MKRVAKLILIDENNTYLLLRRSNHPSFPHDPDLPGGIVEGDESPISALAREVAEEVGITLEATLIEKVYESSSYDNGYTYYLYCVKCKRRPTVTISREHSYYEWLTLDDFLSKTYTAVDKYMRMVYDYLSQNSSRPVG